MNGSFVKVDSFSDCHFVSVYFEFLSRRNSAVFTLPQMYSLINLSKYLNILSIAMCYSTSFTYITAPSRNCKYLFSTEHGSLCGISNSTSISKFKATPTMRLLLSLITKLYPKSTTDCHIASYTSTKSEYLSFGVTCCDSRFLSVKLFANMLKDEEEVSHLHKSIAHSFMIKRVHLLNCFMFMLHL